MSEIKIGEMFPMETPLGIHRNYFAHYVFLCFITLKQLEPGETVCKD